MRIVIDLDGTICEIKRAGQSYADVKPLPGAVERIRALRAAHHTVIISTARNMQTCESNLGKVMKNIGKITLDWLEQHGIEYDEIYFGKPNAEVYIDDRALTFESWDAITETALADKAKTPVKVVVPMAGRGSRFADAGIDTPKPLIDVAGQPMLTWALKSLTGIGTAQMIFIILREHDQKYALSALLKQHYPDAEIVLLPDVTGGQLETVLAARDLIDSEEDVLVANCDTYLVTDLMHTIRSREPDVAGIISVAQMSGNRWSFVRVDESGRALEVAEKVRISPHASTGFYYFANGHQLVAVASEMIRHGEKTRGEYYVIPVYQKYIERGWKVTIAPVREMWDMGTPEALAAFKAHLRA